MIKTYLITSLFISLII